MDILTFDRIPLPSLGSYVGLSLLAASSSFYYIWKESQLVNHQRGNGEFMLNSSITLLPYLENNPKSSYLDQLSEDGSYKKMLKEEWTNNGYNLSYDPDRIITGNGIFTWLTAYWASQQPHCVWPLVNLAYCILIVLSYFVQKSVFGNLRASEQENIKDQFWNLIFYKFVFIFGVVNVQEVEDAVGWCFFVSVIGFLQFARQVSKERHNYLMVLNVWTRRCEIQRRRIIGLLSFIFLSSVFLLVGVCGWYLSSTEIKENDGLTIENSVNETLEYKIRSSPYSFNLGIHNAFFMISEIGLLAIQTFHALIISILDHFKQAYRRKYGYYIPYPSTGNEEDQNHYITNSVNFFFDVSALLFDLVHHVHMLVCCNLFLSMTSLIVSLQMRARARQIHAILKKRQSFMWLSKYISKYPDACPVGEECEENCAICWESITSQNSKRLPCNHFFHTSCLKKWLLVSMNCPTCRFSLLADVELNKKTIQPRNFRGGRRPRQTDLTPGGIWGFIHTGQTLLDLFGGWDPELDDISSEGSLSTRSISLFGDFVVQDWTVQAPEANPIRNSQIEVDKRD